MGKVKGTKQERLVVKVYSPWKTFLRRFVALILMAVIGGAGYWYGGLESFEKANQADEEIEKIKTELEITSKNLQDAALKAATLESGSEIDRAATEEVRIINKQLKDQIADLQEEVALYKGIMAPSLNDQGLQVQEFTLDPTADTKRFRYKLILTQVGDNKRFIKGFVGVNLIGVQAGKKAILPLKDVSPEITTVDIKFRYRYFQDITGELSLPDGFVPDQVQVIAQATGGRNARVEKLFGWKELEIKTNVGQ